MSITPEQVSNAFTVVGATPSTPLNYVRYVTNTLQPVTLIVSNSSTIFDIQFFPTSSAAEAGLLFKTETGTTVNRLYPFTLERSGSGMHALKLLVTVDTLGFDTVPLPSKTYNIGFNLVAITSSLQTGGTTTEGTTTGGTTTEGTTTGGRTTTTTGNRQGSDNDTITNQI